MAVKQTRTVSPQVQAALAELQKCQGDFWYWLTTYVKVITKPQKLEGQATARRGLIDFDPWPEQRMVVEALWLHPRVFVLKPRQRGITEIVAAERLWWTQFHPHETHGVIAHEDAAVDEVFSRYLAIYDRQPEFFKKAFPLTKRNENEIRFQHGSYIKVDSARSSGMLGSTLSSLHLSEFAKYTNAEKLLGELLPTLGEDTKVIFETTAFGFGVAYKYWTGQSQIHKIFFPWMMAREYTSRREPDKNRPDVESYCKQWELKPEQRRFVYDKLVNEFNLDSDASSAWRSFHQAFPASADLAFTVAGARYFNRSFRGPIAVPGYLEKCAPEIGHSYTMGVDTASGAPDGDFSSAYVLDVTIISRPKLVARLYDRINPRPFADEVARIARRYDALVVPETNSYGLSVVDQLRQHPDVKLFRDDVRDSTVGAVQVRFGFTTTVKTRPVLLAVLKEFVDADDFDVWDGALQLEINSFAYNDDMKAEAQPGQHDDALIAVALGLIGRAQSRPAETLHLTTRPKTIDDAYKFFCQTLRVVTPDDVFDDDDVGGASGDQPLELMNPYR